MKFLLVAISLIFPLGITTGCERRSDSQVADPAAGAASANPKTDADVISTVTLTGHTEEGRKKWEVRGDTADLSADVVELSPVSATSFGANEVDLTARKGHLTRATQDVKLNGDVVIVGSDGTTMTTASLNWNAQEEQVSTEDLITITHPGMEVIGIGGIGFPPKKEMRLFKEVRVTLTDTDGGITVVTCNGPMEVDYGRMKIRFWDNVLVEEAKGTIRSDRLDVTIDKVTRQMEKATFWGNVQIHRGEQEATAHRADYWQMEERMALTGHPKLFSLAGPVVE